MGGGFCFGVVGQGNFVNELKLEYNYPQNNGHH